MASHSYPGVRDAIQTEKKRCGKNDQPTVAPRLESKLPRPGRAEPQRRTVGGMTSPDQLAFLRPGVVVLVSGHAGLAGYRMRARRPKWPTLGPPHCCGGGPA
jgi:hypothetical protein